MVGSWIQEKMGIPQSTWPGCTDTAHKEARRSCSPNKFVSVSRKCNRNVLEVECDDGVRIYGISSLLVYVTGIVLIPRPGLLRDTNIIFMTSSCRCFVQNRFAQFYGEYFELTGCKVVFECILLRSTWKPHSYIKQKKNNLIAPVKSMEF